MPDLRFTLIGEGPTDDALIPIIVWLLEHPSLRLLPHVDVVPQFVHHESAPDESGFDDRLIATFQNAPTELIFIHRDADGPVVTSQAEAIRGVVSRARQRLPQLPPGIPIVPVREMEAWLLIDEAAIRRVVRNPRGRVPLGLPHLRAIEACQDPKATLRDACRVASELPRRRWLQVDGIRPRAVADAIGSFEALRQLPAFQAFEAEVRDVIREQGWPERLG